jgi:hypothetical protein
MRTLEDIQAEVETNGDMGYWIPPLLIAACDAKNAGIRDDKDLRPLFRFIRRRGADLADAVETLSLSAPGEEDKLRRALAFARKEHQSG